MRNVKVYGQSSSYSWLSQGFDTREKFDETAKTSKDPMVARKQLDTLMKNCIACHSIYHLPEPK